MKGFMSMWLKYYEEQIIKFGSIEEFVKKKIEYKLPLFKIIRKYAIGNSILEAGAGSGVVSIELSKEGYEVTGLDQDPEMVKLSRKLNRKLGGHAKFKKCSILKYRCNHQHSVVFSHGVLEHFDNSTIVQLVNAQLQFGEFVILSVPSHSFKTMLLKANEYVQLVGDERLMSKKQWLSILHRCKGICVEEFAIPCGYNQEFIGFILHKR